MDNKTAIYLSDDEIEQFKAFREHQQKIEQQPLEHPNWTHLKRVAKEMGFGRLNLVIKDKIPVRIEKPMEEILLGIIRS